MRAHMPTLILGRTFSGVETGGCWRCTIRMKTSSWFVVLLAGAVSACGGAGFTTADPFAQDPSSDSGVVDHQVGLVHTDDADAGTHDGSPTPGTVGLGVDPGVDAADPIDAGTRTEEAATPEASVVAEAAAQEEDAAPTHDAGTPVDSGSGTVPEGSADAGAGNDANSADVDATPPPPPPPPPPSCIVPLAGVYLTQEENTQGIPSCTLLQELNGVYYITSSGVGNFSLMCQPSTTPCIIGDSCQSEHGTDATGNPLTGTCLQITPVTK